MRKLLIIVSMFMTFLIGYGKPLQINVEKGAKIPNFELKDFNRVSTKSRKIFNNVITLTICSILRSIKSI